MTTTKIGNLYWAKHHLCSSGKSYREKDKVAENDTNHHSETAIQGSNVAVTNAPEVIADPSPSPIMSAMAAPSARLYAVKHLMELCQTEGVSWSKVAQKICEALPEPVAVILWGELGALLNMRTSGKSSKKSYEPDKVISGDDLMKAVRDAASGSGGSHGN